MNHLDCRQVARRTSFFLIGMVQTHRVADMFVTKPDIIVEVAAIVCQTLSLELDNVRAHFVQKATIVGNHEKRMFV
jgi:hypothetical protein